MRKGEKMSSEMKLKISQSKKGKISPNKGKKFSKEWRKNLSKSHKGKISPWKGKKLSLEIREKISISHQKKLKPEQLIRGILDDRKKVRRERIKKYGGFHSIGEWETLKAQYNWTCPCCNRTEPEIKLTRDHIIPISRGGSDNIENIQPLCNSCNVKKATNSIRY